MTVVGVLPDLKLFPGAVQAEALHYDPLIVHCMHGLAAVQHHIQRRDGAAHLGHCPRVSVYHRSVWLELCPQGLHDRPRLCETAGNTFDIIIICTAFLQTGADVRAKVFIEQPLASVRLALLLRSNLSSTIDRQYSNPSSLNRRCVECCQPPHGPG